MAFFLDSSKYYTFEPRAGTYRKDNTNSITVLPRNRKLFCLLGLNCKKSEKAFTDNEILFSSSYPLDNIEKCYTKLYNA